MAHEFVGHARPHGRRAGCPPRHLGARTCPLRARARMSAAGRPRMAAKAPRCVRMRAREPTFFKNDRGHVYKLMCQLINSLNSLMSHSSQTHLKLTSNSLKLFVEMVNNGFRKNVILLLRSLVLSLNLVVMKIVTSQLLGPESVGAPEYIYVRLLKSL